MFYASKKETCCGIIKIHGGQFLWIMWFVGGVFFGGGGGRFVWGFFVFFEDVISWMRRLLVYSYKICFCRGFKLVGESYYQRISQK